MRSTTVRPQQLPIEVQQQIDACCDKFEIELKRGKSPELADYLRDLPPAGHSQLRREFLAIEMAYLQTNSRGESEGLHLRCPHCQNQVELLADAKLEEITCNSCGDTFSLVDESIDDSGTRAPKKVAHFELVTRLGVGGFGSVWEARDTELDRLVALKIPRKSQLSAREAEQFFREARTAAQLKHPNIVPVHEVGKDGEIIFIVTDLIRGIPMSDWLKEVRPTARETAELCATLAEALAYAHLKGVVHRDLKPSNVMLDRKMQPYVMDFGLAKRELGEITMTVDGTVLGTPAYMSPEQALGKSHWIDRRTDVYSLGIMLFQMLTGELPYRGTAQQQIQQRVSDDAPDPRKLNAHIPLDLSTICLKCVERDANKRFDTAADLAAELRRYLAGEPIRSRPISTLSRAARWAKRKPALALAATLTTVLAIAGPLAAAFIWRANHTIASQLKERNAVISRDELQWDELARKLNSAEDELKSYKRMRPDRVELADWRERLIISFVEKHQIERESLLAAGEQAKVSEQQARQNLGWLYLLDRAGEPELALRHGLEAGRIYSELLANNPANENYRTRSGDCMLHISELQSRLGQREAAQRSAGEALEIRASLAQEHSDVMAFQLDELELREWQVSQSVSRSALNEWRQLKNQVEAKLSQSESDFYTIACYLTGREPALPSNFAPISTGEVLEQDKVN